MMPLDVLGRVVSDRARVVRMARHPDQESCQRVFFGDPGIGLQAGFFGVPLRLEPTAEHHWLSKSHQTNRNARRLSRRRIAQIDARVHARGMAPELPFPEIAFTNNAGLTPFRGAGAFEIPRSKIARD